MRSGVRLVTLAGVDDYETVMYSLDDAAGIKSPKTKDVFAAIGHIVREAGEQASEITSLLEIGTDTALQKVGNRHSHSLGLLGWDRGDFTRRGRQWTVKNGATEADRWNVFETIAAAVDDRCIAEIEECPPAEIIVDITHGYRSQGFLGGAAISFAMAETARRRAASDTERTSEARIRVIYGAFEREKFDAGERTFPIWDITNFITASAWARAFEGVRYGRADEAKRLARQMSKRLAGQGDAGSKVVSQLGDVLSAYADDLALVRLRDLFTGEGLTPGSAKQLTDFLSRPDVSAWIGNELPFLKDIVNALATDADGLTSSTVLAESDGLDAMKQAAKLCMRLERFSEAAVIIREAIVTAYGLRTDLEPRPEPGKRVGGMKCAESRKRDEDALNAAAAPFRRAAPVTENSGDDDDLVEVAPAVGRAPQPADIKLWNSFTQARNDIEHGGLNNQPLSAKILRAQLCTALASLDALSSGATSSADPEDDETTRS